MLGDGPLRGAAERAVAEFGLAGVVHCEGPVAETAPWIAASDAVVLSSRSEGAPMLVVEAKILGRPAIVTAVGGVPDLVRHGVDGWWVPPGSSHDLTRALDAMAADAALRRRLGEAAAEGAAERFGADRLAAATAELYERVLLSQ
jgi:glycosyltransferase involved in cell wall biosynthesis